MKHIYFCLLLFLIITFQCFAQIKPHELTFTRKASQRFVFNSHQSIPLAKLDPSTIVGLDAMHPIKHLKAAQANVLLKGATLSVGSKDSSETLIWLSGFNPFATYTIDLDTLEGDGEIGLEFSNQQKGEKIQFSVLVEQGFVKDILVSMKSPNNTEIIKKSIKVAFENKLNTSAKLIFQLLGSGLVVYHHEEELPQVIAQMDFYDSLDLRSIERIQSYQSNLYFNLHNANAIVNKVDVSLNSGVGLADIRAITYENGDLFLDKGRIWYTMTIRGRDLPQHIQGVFSMDPSVFDLKLEGVIVFDRNDGLWRNEVASHIFYDRKDKLWKGLTTGFSAYANKKLEKKQLLTVESVKDPRFGFSIMKAKPFGIVGDIEDPHLIFDEKAQKWRMLTCENIDGYKAVILESDHWNKNYKHISGPVQNNSTGTSIHKINGQFYCFSGSSDRKIYIYSYPDLKELGTLKMDLPPWDEKSGTRVWPNVVELPDGYPAKYIALMMDRYNYPGMKGPNWTYGALYLFHGQ